MKVYDILKRAANLLGAGEEFSKESGLNNTDSRALTAVNSALFDLCGLNEAQSLLEEINVSPEIADAASYGTAMFLSVSFGDSAKSEFFSKVYSDKRAKLKSQITRVSDTLAKSEGLL